MCGIAGILNPDGKPADPGLLRRMIARIRHRGPDDSGIYTSEHVGLAHARLSIIDLSGGSQPMQIADKSLCITFNGEIFNYIELREELMQKGHRFATRSDTEVILHLYQEYGDRCVERLNGQWAFAIWDVPKRRLFLSRDRLGVRPLFYTQTAGGSFLIASEIKALLACDEVPRELDLQGLDQIFSFWVTQPPRTAFRGIHQLPPGHSMVLEGGRLTVSQYWDLQLAPGDEDADGSVKRLTEEFLGLMVDATRIRLRSDVPVGTYLSGGIDSTFITALVKQAVGDRIRSFSVRFDDVEFDESPFQNEASHFIETEHSAVQCSQPNIAEVFPNVIWHAEQPIIRTAPAPLLLLSKLVRESGFKVVLTGEGADEVMGGYDIFKETKIRSFWARRPDSLWRPLLLKRLYPYIEGIQRQSPAYLKKFFQVTDEDLASPFFSHLPRWKLAARLKIFLSAGARAEMQNFNALGDLEEGLPRSFRELSPFGKAQYLEAKLLLPGYILSSQGDRMAMANGVEGRYPFLDYRVVEFAARLPERLKMKVLDQKHLLKQAASGLIPDSVRNRYKQPYRAPDGASFFGPGADYVPDLLSEERIRRNGVFEPRAVAQLAQKFRSGAQTSVADNMAMVGILSTELVMERFVNSGVSG